MPHTSSFHEARLPTVSRPPPCPLPLPPAASTVFIVFVILLGLTTLSCRSAEPRPDGPLLRDGQQSAGEAGADGQAGPPGDGAPVDGAPVDSTSANGDIGALKRYLSFNQALCPAIESGTKKITLRNKHNVAGITVGEWIRLICSTSKKTFKAQVTTVRTTTWGEITPQEYQDDGFSPQAEMLTVMQGYYPGITLSDPSTVYRWIDASPYP